MNEFQFYVSTLEGFVREGTKAIMFLSKKINNQYEDIEKGVSMVFCTTRKGIKDLSSKFEKLTISTKDKDILTSMIFRHHIHIHSK